MKQTSKPSSADESGSDEAERTRRAKKCAWRNAVSTVVAVTVFLASTVWKRLTAAVRAALKELSALLHAVWEWLLAPWKAVKKAVLSWLSALVCAWLNAWLKSAIGLASALLRGLWLTWEAVKPVLSRLSAFSLNLCAWLYTWLKAALGWASALPGRVWEAVKATPGWVAALPRTLTWENVTAFFLDLCARLQKCLKAALVWFLGDPAPQKEDDIPLLPPQDPTLLFSKDPTVAFAGEDAAWMRGLMFPKPPTELSFCVEIIEKARLFITQLPNKKLQLLHLPQPEHTSAAAHRVMCAASTVAIFADRDDRKAATCRPTSGLYVVAHITDMIPTSTNDAVVTDAKRNGDLLPLMDRVRSTQPFFPVLKNPSGKEVHVFVSKSADNSLVAEYICQAIDRELPRTDLNLGALIAEAWSNALEDSGSGGAVTFTAKGTFNVAPPTRQPYGDAALVAVDVSWRIVVEPDWSADASSTHADRAYVLEFTMTGVADDEVAKTNLRNQLAWGSGITLARRGRAACETLSVVAYGPGGQRVRAHTELQEHNIGESGAPMNIRINPTGLVQIQFWPGQIDD